MGSYSVICAVSGAPLEFFNEVVGVELEPYRWPGDRYAYVPASWPVFGRYDTYGGVESAERSPESALIHRSVWDNAEMYWHVENRKCGRDFLNAQAVLTEAKRRYEQEEEIRRLGYGAEYHWTFSDYVWYELQKQFTRTDEGLTLREMLNGKNHNVTNVPEGVCFLERSWLGELIVQRIIAGWTDEDSDILYRLACLWCGQMLTGRQIVPSVHISIEQCPLYRQRIKISQFHTRLLRENVAEWKSRNKDRKV